MSREIITGVDKLVQIIDAAGGRISLKDAMKQMKVSKELIEDWANTLEESKTISIEYKLFNTYLVRGVSKKDLVKQAKELTLKEEAFEENLKVSLKDFEDESEGLSDIGKEFDKLSDELKTKRKAIEHEIKNLYEFHKLNKTFKEELENVDKRTEKYKKSIEDAINSKKAEYGKLLETIDKEKKAVDEKSKRLNEFIRNAEKLNSEISQSKKNIGQLQEAAEKIEPKIKVLEKDTVSKFIKSQEEAVKRISDKQKAFLSEIMLKRRFMKIGLKENQMIKDKVDRFFDKQKELEGKFLRLYEERDRIISELKEIMKLAENYKAMAKRKDMTKEFKKLQEKSAELNKRKQKFKEDLKDLQGKVKGSGKSSKGTRPAKTQSKKGSKDRKKPKKKKR